MGLNPLHLEMDLKSLLSIFNLQFQPSRLNTSFLMCIILVYVDVLLTEHSIDLNHKLQYLLN